MIIPKRTGAERMELYLTFRQLLKIPDDDLRDSPIRSLVYLGVENAVDALEAFKQDQRHPQSLRELAEQMLSAVSERAARFAESRISLRAADGASEASNLLRAPDSQTLIPNEQLLRPAGGDQP